ncbi:hypothetical protein OPTIMUS_50 [Mycobacterium phage Optimus]|uniref:Uncharacterized protein n=5 Tax=root TaxID=1 RepID=A0A3S9UAR5_9CAUD|nr:hypothetical protein N857_gp051 [Mycobacterium phage Wanda]YP_009124004.1 hypothetical protein VC71_gp051 [Mycobacterium phage Minerva]YP_009590906.1 hypothetical protein FDG54_gp050 [Mycobacterium phage Optimus]YP_009636220.1 hypothetical protein FGG20_gp049 [Mycobacterium phage Baka]ATN88855.1 hypothetical protein SEA_DMPSTRDIVER_46 [Mycobacterium phage DmpstrDiver]AZS07389.1 hypothetical protein PBI_DUKE13_48 [Mycobacterium phage Duke13]KZA06337.1 hypothetical protein LV35_04262 [Acinet
MQKILISLIVGVLTQAVRNPEIREFVSGLVLKLADKLKDDLVPALIGLFPTFGGAIIKSALDSLPGVKLPDIDVINSDVAKKIIDSDPDLPFVSDIIDITEILKGWIK